VIEVPDASVAVKWVLRQGEGGLDAADEVRRRVIAGPEGFAVPALFLYEVQAVLCRRSATAEGARQRLLGLIDLAIPVVEPDGALLARATEIAFQFGLTGYDAAYVALAQHLHGQWLTCDRRACERVRPLGVARFIGPPAPPGPP
jgi:predicted nucleic acid-binding protein